MLTLLIQRTGQSLSFSLLYFPFSTNFYGEVNEQQRNWGTYWSTNNRPAGQASVLAVSFSSEASNTASPGLNLSRGKLQSGRLKEVQKMFITADVRCDNESCQKVPPWSPDTGGGGWLFCWDRLGGDGRWSTHTEQQHEWTRGRRLSYLKRQQQYDRLTVTLCRCAVG